MTGTKLVADGQLFIGSTAVPNVNVGTLASANSSITITNGAGTIDLAAKTGSGRAGFSAYSDTAVTNVTGDGTEYTVVFGTELFDTGGCFDGTSTFTAPITGNYLFTYTLLLSNTTAANAVNSRIVTTARSAYLGGFTIIAGGSFYLPASIILPMTSGDTAVVKAVVNGGTKTVGVFGGAGDIRTTFCATLI